MLEMFCYARDIETYSSSTDPSLKLLSVASFSGGTVVKATTASSVERMIRAHKIGDRAYRMVQHQCKDHEIQVDRTRVARWCIVATV